MSRPGHPIPDKRTLREILDTARKATCTNCGKEYTTPYTTVSYATKKSLLVEDSVCRQCRESKEQEEYLKKVLEPR